MQSSLHRSATLSPQDHGPVLNWAVERRTALVLSVLADENWSSLKAAFLRHDPGRRLIQITYPQAGDHPAEIVAGQRLGLSFRRGHKKCVFTTTVAVRQAHTEADGTTLDTLVLHYPDQMQELQRRSYQRVTCPTERFVAVRLWEGPSIGEGGSWPLCSGRLGNVSVGGAQVDIRVDQNPRLSIGDRVGVEITVSPGKPPLLIDAQYRHCAITAPGRLGLGFQFLGLEHERPERASIQQVATFVKEMQRYAARMERHVNADSHSPNQADTTEDD